MNFRASVYMWMHVYNSRLVLIAHFSVHSPIHKHTVSMKRPLSLHSLFAFCVTLSVVVSVVIPLSIVWEAVASLLEQLYNEFK